MAWASGPPRPAHGEATGPGPGGPRGAPSAPPPRPGWPLRSCPACSAAAGPGWVRDWVLRAELGRWGAQARRRPGPALRAAMLASSPSASSSSCRGAAPPLPEAAREATVLAVGRLRVAAAYSVLNEGAEGGAAPRSVPKVKGVPRSQAEAREAPPSSPPPARFAGNRFPWDGRGRSAAQLAALDVAEIPWPAEPPQPLRGFSPSQSPEPLRAPVGLPLPGRRRPTRPPILEGIPCAAAVRHLHPGLKCTAVLKEIHPHPTQIHPQRCLNTPHCPQKFLPKPDAWTTRAEIRPH
ncbi:sterile alpha motif domain-containing protein 1-like [Pongo abelii]|uniref:sterile alpha motif domain-containing protein 1-like n=1 Tax=Pongo abelii TaxID=9601 RepID=UPI000CEFB3F9|nr:sterile alpha motif domain-containing protein 1-like [Pongo abelii]